MLSVFIMASAVEWSIFLLGCLVCKPVPSVAMTVATTSMAAEATTQATTTEAYTTPAYPDLSPWAPKKTDAIAIVGADATGMHMAALLSDAGYKDVNVFEGSKRVGYRSYTYYRDETPHEMGDAYVWDNTSETVYWNKRYDAGQMIDAPLPTVWNSATDKKSFKEYLLQVANSVSAPTTHTLENVTSYYASLLTKYQTVHKSKFGEYEGHMMKRPVDADLVALNKTFIKFLEDNDLKALKSIFYIVLSSKGIDINSLPAIYGLMWITPKLAEQLSDNIVNDRAIAKMYKHGHQSIWEKIHTVKKIDVKLEHTVTKIYRYPEQGKIWLYYKKKKVSPGTMSNEFKRKFDFVIIAINPIVPTDKIRNITSEEEYLLDNIKYTTGTYSIVETRVTDPERKLDLYEYNSGPYKVQWCRDNYPAPTIPSGSKDTLKTSICFQGNDIDAINATIIKQEMADHLEAVGATVDGTFMNARKGGRRWVMSGRYSMEHVAHGDPWDLLGIQGKNAMWYIGRSSSFESLEVALSYNQLLLKLSKIEMPDRKSVF